MPDTLTLYDRAPDGIAELRVILDLQGATIILHRPSIRGLQPHSQVGIGLNHIAMNKLYRFMRDNASALALDIEKDAK